MIGNYHAYQAERNDGMPTLTLSIWCAIDILLRTAGATERTRRGVVGNARDAGGSGDSGVGGEINK